MGIRYIKSCLKGLAVILALIPALSLAVLPVSAASNTAVSVSAPAQPVSPGQQFTVNITVQPGSAIAGAQFDLSFDPSLVSVNSVTEGNLFNQSGAGTYFMPGTVDNTAGTITGVAGVITTPGQTVSTAGTLAVITMTAGPISGTCPLNLSGVIVGDISGQALTVGITSGEVIIDQPPVLNLIGDQTVNEGSLLSFTISATDPDGDTLTYSAYNLPPGATFNASTQTFSWTPTYTQAGHYPNVQFEVSDGHLTASENITISVKNISGHSSGRQLGKKKH